MPAEPAAGLVQRTEERRRASTDALDPGQQAELGQYFTPGRVADFMASLPRSPKEGTVRILDPGAGVGSLTASMVARIIQDRPGLPISITVCEIDQNLHATLYETLQDCVNTARDSGSHVEVKLVRENFIVWASSPASLFGGDEKEFDLVIMNPPYRKLARNSKDRKLTQSVTTDASNAYTAFLSLGAHLLAPSGQMVAITPRSFTNGPYFRVFRKYFLNRVQLDHVHIFEARNKIFADTFVLQENVIFSVTRKTAAHGEGIVTISSSSGQEDNPEKRIVPYEEVVHPGDSESFIHLGIGGEEPRAASLFDSVPCTLSEIGMQVSTGRVVDFRSRTHLRKEPEEDTIPLIYPLHMHDSLIRWPLIGAKKSNAIVLNAETDKLTFPSGFYVVVKRLSSKEEKRRVVAAVFDPTEVPSGRIGFENHVNVFHQNGEGLANEVAKGLCLWLNSSTVDWAIRQFSGHTQVNATDLRSLRYPSVEQLSAIGRSWDQDVWLDQSKIDELVENYLQPGGVETRMTKQVDADASQTPEIKKVSESRQLLRLLNFDDERCNERSALVLLALLNLGKNAEWRNSERPMLRTVQIMSWLRENYGKDYAANTRETIRRFTLHQFVEAGLVVQNPDRPDRPINSPKWCYQITPAAFSLIATFTQDGFQEKLESYLEELPGLKKIYARERDMVKIPLQFNKESKKVLFSPGGQNPLLVQTAQEFCGRYTPNGELLYAGDAKTKWATFEREKLAALGVEVDSHGKMPDLVVYLREKNWLVLIEVASSHGPVDSKRYGELSKLFEGASAGLVFISAFPTRVEFRKYARDIAWETDVWCADSPDHLIHFNGTRFLGPYNNQENCSENQGSHPR
ncbi:BsuBI/PstI family type II restriction endonuclease [Streptomyces malaysiensis]|uniref:BsuBI/PstI family type II restriction endonuclease n=1 Tax=Streptomyces malaysiensis TaxID=92644 RepID=UPI0009A1BA33|nr:BsuBI/PstI family type II restriction endonuclease [Streptomyces autolyticus]